MASPCQRTSGQGREGAGPGLRRGTGQADGVAGEGA